MIIKRRRKEYYEPPEKEKRPVWVKILLVAIGVILFIFGFFSAHPVFSALGLL